jgi:CheY-like chemotaxis protein
MAVRAPGKALSRSHRIEVEMSFTCARWRHGLPILALTANVMRGDKEKTLEAGCDGYIQKPLDIDQLIKEVERFLARSAHV